MNARMMSINHNESIALPPQRYRFRLEIHRAHIESCLGKCSNHHHRCLHSSKHIRLFCRRRSPSLPAHPLLSAAITQIAFTTFDGILGMYFNKYYGISNGNYKRMFWCIFSLHCIWNVSMCTCGLREFMFEMCVFRLRQKNKERQQQHQRQRQQPKRRK